MNNRINLYLGLGIAAAALIGSSLALMRYAEPVAQDGMSTGSNSGPLEVRTDLMRNMGCHVADGSIMGKCSEEQIRQFQLEAQ